MHERWSRGEDLHNRAISLSPSAHMFIIFTPPPTPTPSLVRVYRTNPSAVINSPASLARVNTLMAKLNSAPTVISGLIKQQEYVCLHVRFQL